MRPDTGPETSEYCCGVSTPAPAFAENQHFARAELVSLLHWAAGRFLTSPPGSRECLLDVLDVDGSSAAVAGDAPRPLEDVVVQANTVDQRR